jgi:carboxymethylenebutenolidase
MAVKVRSVGGVSDDQVVGDVAACLRYLKVLPNSNGKVGVTGTCSGGRHTYLAACRVPGFDAAVDLWGGRVVMTESDLTPKQPVAPLDYTKDLSCPLLGLFGEEDRSPTPEQVAIHEAELKKHGKSYEFHMYPGAGHGFFYHDRPAAYRAEQAVDGWKKLLAFFGQHLSA